LEQQADKGLVCLQAPNLMHKKTPSGTALSPQDSIVFVVFLPHFISPHVGTIQQVRILTMTLIVLVNLKTFLYMDFAGTTRQLLSSPAKRRLQENM
jgi:threonine/homoserine/homoserine lactone efflux protein